MVHPNEYLGAGQGLAVPTKVIKQADVVMMLNLFRTRFTAKIKKANWEYYEPRTEHGSSLSACAYAMVATEFNNLDLRVQILPEDGEDRSRGQVQGICGKCFHGRFTPGRKRRRVDDSGPGFWRCAGG